MLYEIIVGLTDAFCAEHLDAEYAQLCRDLAAALARKRQSPLRLSSLNAWACGIVYAVGSVNFLFDPSQTPYMSATELCQHFGVSKSNASAKGKTIRELFRIRQGDPRWWRPSQLAGNPLAWLIEVDGLVVDARSAPAEIQAEAWRLGLIPFLPSAPAPEDHAARAAVMARRVEEMAGWCASSPELASVRRNARKAFFTYGNARGATYWSGTGGRNARQRRFVGWFMFSFRLPDGRRPAELAAAALYSSADLSEALQAVQGTRYVLGIISSTDGCYSASLELQDEQLNVRSATWAQGLVVGSTVVAHLVPVTPELFVPGPGWLEWPARIGPNMRRELKQFQPDPVQVERVLQRAAGRDGHQGAEHPSEATLDRAVAKMAAAASAAGRSNLVMSTDDWRLLVLEHMAGADPTSFPQEIFRRLGGAGNIDELNRWMRLATDIWNATPQPDRGGKSAYELMHVSTRRSEK
jgi:hypothetical protein